GRPVLSRPCAVSRVLSRRHGTRRGRVAPDRLDWPHREVASAEAERSVGAARGGSASGDRRIGCSTLAAPRRTRRTGGKILFVRFPTMLEVHVAGSNAGLNLRVPRVLSGNSLARGSRTSP